MKILLAVVALSFVICSDAYRDRAMVHVPKILKCVEDVDMEEFTRWSHKNIRPADVSAETRCAIKCILEIYNAIEEDTGELTTEGYYKVMIQGSIAEYGWNKMVEACQYFKTDTTCDKAFMTLACFDLYTQFVSID